MKKSCWEFKNCGRQEGGEYVHDFGICPATVEQKLNGVHGGKNAGRACWVVAGTMCGGRVQGTFAQKYETCETCDFFRAVKKEEGSSYELSLVLLNRMKASRKIM